MIYETEPDNFNPEFVVVGCFAQHRRSILFLRRNPDKDEGGKWGIPAGKIKEGESIDSAMIREFQEETGLTLIEGLRYLSKTFVRYPNYDFIFHLFRVKLDPAVAKHSIRINPKEHSEFWWKEPHEALRLDLVRDQDWFIKRYYLSS